MNQAHFAARYSQIGIDLQTLINKAAYKMSVNCSNDYFYVVNEPEKLLTDFPNIVVDEIKMYSL